MFEGFERTEIATRAGGRIHLRHGGSGPPLLLLHGNPQTHVSWHRIADRLARRFRVLAADLRGYGDSTGPDPADLSNYTLRTMAQDQVEVMEALGHPRFMVTGHDRGARTAWRWTTPGGWRGWRCSTSCPTGTFGGTSRPSGRSSPGTGPSWCRKAACPSA